MNVDMFIWMATGILLIAGVLVMLRRRSVKKDPDEYDPEDDWDELDEEWDSDAYGSRPWRPGKRKE